MFSKKIEIVITLLQNVSNSGVGGGDGDGGVGGFGDGGKNWRKGAKTGTFSGAHSTGGQKRM